MADGGVAEPSCEAIGLPVSAVEAGPPQVPACGAFCSDGEEVSLEPGESAWVPVKQDPSYRGPSANLAFTYLQGCPLEIAAGMGQRDQAKGLPLVSNFRRALRFPFVGTGASLPGR